MAAAAQPVAATDPPDVRHRRTAGAARAGGDGLDLPARLSLFGHTRLPVTEVELLAALASTATCTSGCRSPRLPCGTRLADLDGVVARDEDTSADRVGHPLLASLGRDARELRARLLTGGSPRVTPPGCRTTSPTRCSAGSSTTCAPTTPRPSRSARSGDLGRRRPEPAGARAATAPARQVDVLREVLVGLLEDDPTLEPRDILVMCPDIETFAPLISAGFGLAPATASRAAATPPTGCGSGSPTAR